jgi:hypothetical protein
MAGFIGKVENGKLVLTDQQAFLSAVREQDGKEVVVSLSNDNKQLAYFYAAVVTPLAGYMKLSKEQTVAFLEGLFLAEVHSFNGYHVPTVRHVSSLEKEELTQFITQVKDFIENKLNLVIE